MSDYETKATEELARATRALAKLGSVDFALHPTGDEACDAYLGEALGEFMDHIRERAIERAEKDRDLTERAIGAHAAERARKAADKPLRMPELPKRDLPKLKFGGR